MKLIVEIDIPNGGVSDEEALRLMKEDVQEGYIAVDEAELTKLPQDDSFYMFKLIRIAV